MANSLFKNPASKAQLGRNGFDLSRRRLFTSMAGQLLPVFKDFATPGESYKLNSRLFIRTQPLQTAAFTRMTAYCDWFFVPITQIWSLWNEFYNRVNDVTSSAFDMNDVENSLNMPLFNVKNLLTLPETASDFLSTYKTTGSNTEITAKVDDMGIPYFYNFRRLYDLLGYGTVQTNDYSQKTGSTKDIFFNFFDFMAYHRIYYSFYNKGDWFKTRPDLWNVDCLFTGNSNKQVPYYEILSRIHYRPFKVDYFTNVFPQPVFNNEFANSIAGEFVSPIGSRVFDNGLNREDSGNLHGGYNNDITVRDGYPSTPEGYQTAVSQFLAAASGVQMKINDNLDGTRGITLSELRSMYALDKLLRVTAMNGNHYEQQTLAHLGYKMPRGIDNDAYYLGSQTCPVNINEVVASATTNAGENGDTLGDIAGKGFASSDDSQDIDFTAPCHGFVMCIYSVVADPDYASLGCEVQNRYRSALDFWRPELDNLGLQPLFGQFNGFGNTPNSEDVFGWTYRWSELKTSFDVVNEGFYRAGLRDWVTYKQDGYKYGDVISPYNMFYCSPQYTNNIFYLDVPKYSNTVNGHKLTWTSNNLPIDMYNGWNITPLRAQDCYEHDNFLISADFKCFKSSPMSVHSLPKLL